MTAYTATYSRRTVEAVRVSPARSIRSRVTGTVATTQQHSLLIEADSIADAAILWEEEYPRAEYPDAVLIGVVRTPTFTGATAVPDLRQSGRRLR